MEPLLDFYKAIMTPPGKPAKVIRVFSTIRAIYLRSLLVSLKQVFSARLI